MSVKQLSLKVHQVVKVTADAIKVEFEPPEVGPLQYKSGQFLTLLVQVDQENLRRAYSLCSSPLTDPHPAVAIKRVDKGKVSNFLNDQLKAGDEIEVLEPMGVFTTEFDAAHKRHVVLFGGGSGITPLMSILKSLLKEESQSRISLIYANRDQDSIIFKEELEELVQQHSDRFTIVHVLEKAPMFWSKGHKGRLSTKLLKKILNKLPDWGSSQTEYFMCGPSGMMTQITKSFKELGLPVDKLKKESFGISPEEAAAKKAKSVAEELASDSSEELKEREIKVIYAGEEHVFTVAPDKTILETAQSLDIDLPYSCQSGMCTACMGRCTSGKVKLDEEDALT
ncbi:MAG: ferredoxin--NADP reductase, partial [Bacteroidota bacterium]